MCYTCRVSSCGVHIWARGYRGAWEVECESRKWKYCLPKTAPPQTGMGHFYSQESGMEHTQAQYSFYSQASTGNKDFLVSVPSFHTLGTSIKWPDFIQEPKDSEKDCLISNTWYFCCHFLLVLLSLHVVGYDFGLCWDITGESIWRRTGICSPVKSPQSTISESEEL